MQFVACWLGGANVEQVAHVWAEVLAEIEVGNDWCVVFEPETNWRWRRKHFLAKWLMMNLHFVVDASHLVDLCGVRARSINHYGSIEYFAACQRHACNGAARSVDLCNFLVEVKHRTKSLCSVCKVVCCQHRVIHEATEWVEQCRQLVVWVVGKCRVFNAFWWIELACFERWPTLTHFFRAQHFVGNAELIP